MGILYLTLLICIRIRFRLFSVSFFLYIYYRSIIVFFVHEIQMDQTDESRSTWRRVHGIDCVDGVIRDNSSRSCPSYGGSRGYLLSER